MAANPTRQIFVNMAARDVKKSMDFFAKLGFRFNQQFTDDNAACLIINDHAYVMVLSDSFFKTFTKREICDTAHTESLLAISCAARTEVDDLVNKALAIGGKKAMDPIDHGFMYGRSFYDPDGHHWEVMWMDPTGMPKK